MALHYSPTSIHHHHPCSAELAEQNAGDTKVGRNYSNPMPVQKTPFSIEDILYQRNKNHSTSGGGGCGDGLVLTSAVKHHQQQQQINGHVKGASSEAQQATVVETTTTTSGSDFVCLKARSELGSTAGDAEKKSSQHPNKCISGGHSYAQAMLNHSSNNHLSHNNTGPGPQYSSPANSVHSMYPTGPTYSDGYLHMIAPYLASTATGYKSVDPYFLSQGKTMDGLRGLYRKWTTYGIRRF